MTCTVLPQTTAQWWPMHPFKLTIELHNGSTSASRYRAGSLPNPTSPKVHGYTRQETSGNKKAQQRPHCVCGSWIKPSAVILSADKAITATPGECESRATRPAVCIVCAVESVRLEFKSGGSATNEPPPPAAAAAQQLVAQVSKHKAGDSTIMDITPNGFELHHRAVMAARQRALRRRSGGGGGFGLLLFSRLVVVLRPWLALWRRRCSAAWTAA